MRKILLQWACAASAVVLALSIPSSIPKDTPALSGKPNIVFILADDMRKDDLKYMPKTRNLLKAKGMSFQNAFVSNALCCPARATIMRGQYTHNTGVWTNGGSIGGWQAYKSNGNEQDNVATRLDAAGYRTGLFGKYLNGYRQTTGRPPGWDRWFAHVNGIGYYDYQINHDGTTRHYGSTSSAYETRVMARHAMTFIGTSANAGVPFFAYVSPYAPHNARMQGAPVPAPRDRHAYDGLKASRLPSFNERDVSEKPSWIRQLPRLSDAKKADIDKRHEKRAESLQAVDDLVAGVVGKLRAKGVMGNTYIFFTSDNGLHEGEHRIKGEKWRPYEEDIHMPLLVRGPGVAAGHEAHKLALDTDFLPTFTNLACSQSSPCDTQNWSYVPDGRSLKPVLDGNATAWRSAILLEAERNDVNVPNAPAYRGIRTRGGIKYVEYAGGEKELYYLGRDPYELINRYPASRPSSGLVSRLHALKTCAGMGCRPPENGRSVLGEP
jgi:N-acetylglucosamine-6-sulfatase